MNQIKINNIAMHPSKIICIGRNYVEHILELNNETPTEAVIFMKPNSAIGTQMTSDAQHPIHYEGEIAFVVKNGQLFGVGFGLDLTKRDIQNGLKAKGLPWERAKAFDGSALFSDFIEWHAHDSMQDLRLELWINGVLKQAGGVELMLYKPAQILSEINSFSTLVDGDIIMTGTPKGVGVVNHKDEFVGKIFNKSTLLLEKSWQVA